MTADVRRLDGRRLQPKFFGGVAERRTSCQGVINLVRHLVDPIDRLLTGEIGFELGLGLVEGLRHRRLDLDDPQDMPPERGFDRVARLVQGQFERGLAERARHLLAPHQAEIDRIRVLPGDHGRNLPPVLAGGQRRLGLLRLFLGGRQDLLYVAPFGDLQLILTLIVLFLQLRFRDLDVLDDIRGVEADKRKAPIFGGAEQVRMLVVERLQLLLARLSDIGDPGGRQRDDVGGALLVAVAVEQIDDRLRRCRPGRHGVQQVVARDVAAQQRDILIFGQIVGGEHRVEQAAVETPVGSLEAGVRGYDVADQIIRNVELQPRRLLVDQAAVDQLRKRLVDEAELLGLLQIDRTAESSAQLFERPAQSRLQFLRADAVVPDRGDHRVATAIAEYVADPPDAEGQDQEREQNFDDVGSRSRADRLQH